MSIWQTKPWWEMLKASNQADEIFEINWIQIEKRKVSMWEYGLFILWFEKELNWNDVNKLIELCKKENALFIQLETISYGNNSKLQILDFKSWYYKKFITPYTAVINTKETEEEILAKMKPKGRYNIKLATKKWVEVKEVEKTDANIQEYYNLMLETTSRDSFSWNSIDYYKTFLNSLNQSKLLLAYVDEVVVAGWIFTFDKEVSIYYYWASTSNKQYRNLMAPYLLQWEAIKIAKNMWSKLYDFLWVATPGDTNSELAWVTDFKLKLSADVRNISDSYIWINKWFKYFLINLLRKLKRK
jgi:lipid II:glycine glycyltransferase (peptidoglycan interpeptide bridge formation enzyme)